MTMAQPPIITTPWAKSGDVVTIPVATDPNGFASFTTGYTSDYEILLGSGNPRAKAVERTVQNALFNILSTNIQQWQQASLSIWQSSMPGGYDQNAYVLRQGTDNIWRPYRSLVAANSSDPQTTPASWAYVPLPSEMIANIPMRAGGANGSTAEVITVATDFNTIQTGTYEIGSDAIAAASANSPSSLAGILEVKYWTLSGSTFSIQRYMDRNGFIYTRGAAGASWVPWVAQASQSFASSLQMAYRGFLTYSAATTLPNNFPGYKVTFTGSTGFTATLPTRANALAASFSGARAWFVNANSQNVVVAAGSGNTINGSASVTLLPGETLELVIGSGTDWATDDGTWRNAVVPMRVASPTLTSQAPNVAYGDARWAALGGNSSQTFLVANPTLATHAVNVQYGDLRYAALNGSTANAFNVAASASGSNNAVPRWQSDALYAPIAGNASQAFSVAAATVGTNQAVPISQADSRYAFWNGNAANAFNVAATAGGSNNAIPRWQGDALYAALNGNASNAFNVAAGQSNTQAVRLDQFPGSMVGSGYQKFPQTSGTYKQLMIQWGFATIGANTQQGYALPGTFPNGGFTCVVCRTYGGSNAAMNGGISSANPTWQIIVQNYGTASETFNYIAIGW